MTIADKTDGGGNRVHWLDNLRTITIFMVVLYHVGGVYEAAGLWGWFWIVDDPTTMTWVGIVGIIFDILVMPLMFFIAGYFAQISLSKTSGWEFIKGKFSRLVVPWVLAVVTLIPIYKVIFLYSRNLPQEHWSTYTHLTNQNSQNWLWFLPLLFTFNIIYLLINRLAINKRGFSLATVISGLLVIGLAYSLAAGGIFGFRSWTLTPVIDFENERLLLYFFSFLTGSMFSKQNIFAGKPGSKKMYMIVNYTAWLPITAHIIIRLVPFFYPDGFSYTLFYRFIWWLSFDASLICLVYLMIESFRRYVDKGGKIWNELNRNSYGVYVIHVIMIGIFGTLLLQSGLAVAIKYPLLIISTYMSSNLLVSAYRRVKGIMQSQPARRHNHTTA